MAFLKSTARAVRVAVLAAIAFGHISMNYLIYAPRSLAIVGGSLASLAALAGAFGFCATAPAPPRFERAPSPCFACGKQALEIILRVPLCRDSGVSLSGPKEK